MHAVPEVSAGDKIAVNERQDQARVSLHDVQGNGLVLATETLLSPTAAVEASKPDGRVESSGGYSLDEMLAGIERREILSALQRANGQRTAAAQFLRISRARLYRRMDALGIDPQVVDSRARA